MERKNFLVIDTNIGIDHALALGKLGHKVYYCIDCREPYPRMQSTISGRGFSEIKKINDYGKVLYDVDCVIFTDVGYGNLADWLRNDFPVLGADRISQYLELDRIYAKRIMEEYEIATPKYQIIKGVKKLREFIQDNPEKKFFIKINEFRGNIETFSVSSVEELDLMLGNAGFGPFGDVVEFCVEEASPGVEIGADIFFNGEEFLQPHLYTIEVKGMGNIARYVEDSVFMEQVFNRIQPYLVENGYHGNISVEGFLDEDGIFRVIDWTTRFPFPGSAIFSRAIKNYDEVLWCTASGEHTSLVIEEPFWVEMGIYTSDQIWKEIHFPAEYYPHIGFRRVVKKDDRFIYVPGDSLVCTISTGGYSLREAMNACLNVAKEVSVFTADSPVGMKQMFMEIVEELNKIGDKTFIK
jgi:hypothetical protein